MTIDYDAGFMKIKLKTATFCKIKSNTNILKINPSK